MKKTAVVLGVGPLEGLGAALCIRFASRGLHVLIAGRTQANLERVVDEINSKGGSSEALLTDATDEHAVKSLFARAGDSLDLAVYNAGNNTPGRIAEMDAAYFEASWRVCCFGGFLFGREAVNTFATRAGGGTLLFTGASASLRGRPGFGAFNSSKAGLRNLAQAMAKEYAVDGVHVGHMIIDGPIAGDKIRTRNPEYAARLGEEGMIRIDGIVDGYEYMYDQTPTAWTFEMDVRTSKENW